VFAVHPRLQNQIAVLFRFRLEIFAPQPFGDRLVVLFVEDRQRHPDIEVKRAHVCLYPFGKILLIDDQRRDETADDHQIVHQAAQRGGDLETGSAHELDRRVRVPLGGFRFDAHLAFAAPQSRYSRRTASCASFARSG